MARLTLDELNVLADAQIEVALLAMNAADDSRLRQERLRILVRRILRANRISRTRLRTATTT